MVNPNKDCILAVQTSQIIKSQVMENTQITITEEEKEMFDYLNEVRMDGEINMNGAAPWLVTLFGLDKIEAREVLSKWKANFNPDGYENLRPKVEVTEAILKTPETPFTNARELKKENPNTFFAPSEEHLKTIEVGDSVKVSTGGERFWMTVSELTPEEGVIGIVDNDLICSEDHGLFFEDKVAFKLENIHNILR